MRLIERSEPAVQTLEPRRLLSGISFGHGKLTITGTPHDDVIVVQVDPADSTKYRATLDGKSRDFPIASVHQILISGGSAGNDQLTIDESNGPVLAPATLLGSAGNDTIRGGAGYDLLEGGAGNDLIIAGSGPTQLYGGPGNNTLIGGSGNDTLGGANEDAFWFYGKRAPAASVSGRDSIVCGSGNDWVVGDDSLQIHAPATIVAGSGQDTLDARDSDVIVGRKPGDVVPTEDTYGTPAPGQTQFAIHTHAVINIYINDNGAKRRVHIVDGVGNFNAHGAFYAQGIPKGTANPYPPGILLHMRDVVVRQFALGEFFRNWGVSFDANHIGRYIVGNGHTLTMTVNGVPNTQFGNYVVASRSHLVGTTLVDDEVDQIVIRYK